MTGRRPAGDSPLPVRCGARRIPGVRGAKALARQTQFGRLPPVANRSFLASRLVTLAGLHAAEARGAGVTPPWRASQ